MLFIHQRKLLHENQTITVPAHFFKALFGSIKVFAMHFVFTKMTGIFPAGDRDVTDPDLCDYKET